jgi:hypothetical protein
VTGEWRKLHDEELQAVLRFIRSWRQRWAGHVAGMGEMKNAYKILDGNPEDRRRLGRQGADGRITSK